MDGSWIFTDWSTAGTRRWRRPNYCISRSESYIFESSRPRPFWGCIGENKTKQNVKLFFISTETCPTLRFLGLDQSVYFLFAYKSPWNIYGIAEFCMKSHFLNRQKPLMTVFLILAFYYGQPWCFMGLLKDIIHMLRIIFSTSRVIGLVLAQRSSSFNRDMNQPRTLSISSWTRQ